MKGWCVVYNNNLNEFSIVEISFARKNPIRKIEILHETVGRAYFIRTKYLNPKTWTYIGDYD